MPEPNAFKEVTDAVKQATKDVTKQITGLAQDGVTKIRQTFSEEMEELMAFGETVFGRVKAAVSPMFAYLTRFFFKSKFLQGTLATLKNLLKIEKKREKRDLAKMGLKKDWWGLILKGMGLLLGGAAGLAIGALGAILAPILGPIIKPVEIMVKAFRFISGKLSAAKKFFTAKDPFGLGAFSQPMKEGGILRRIFDWFKGLKRFFPKSVITAAETGIKWAGKIGKWIGKIGKLFMKAVRFVGKWGGSFVIKAFMKGLNKIFWPFQIVMSAIEFVKGFMATEGDFVDKWVGGVKAVIKDFFGFPISLFGKLIDWVAEKFGIENLGAEKFLTDGFNKFVDTIAKLPIWVKDQFLEKMGMAFNAIKEIDFVDMITGVFDFIVGIWDRFIIKIHEWAQYLPDWMIKDSTGGLLKGLESMAESAEERESDRLAREQLEIQKQTLEEQKKMNQKTLGNTQINNVNSGGGSSGRMTPAKGADAKEVTTATDPLFALMG